MKTLLAATALVMIVSAGSPVKAQVMSDQGYAGAAFAQATTQRARPVVQQRSPAQRFRADRPDGRVHSSNPAYDVYDGNTYVGSDPDVAIRNELLRDQPERND